MTPRRRAMRARCRLLLEFGCWPDAALLESVQAYGGDSVDAQWVADELDINPPPEPASVAEQTLRTARPGEYARHNAGRVEKIGR